MAHLKATEAISARDANLYLGYADAGLCLLAASILRMRFGVVTVPDADGGGYILPNA